MILIRTVWIRHVQSFHGLWQGEGIGYWHDSFPSIEEQENSSQFVQVIGTLPCPLGNGGVAGMDKAFSQKMGSPITPARLKDPDRDKQIWKDSPAE